MIEFSKFCYLILTFYSSISWVFGLNSCLSWMKQDWFAESSIADKSPNCSWLGGCIGMVHFLGDIRIGVN